MTGNKPPTSNEIEAANRAEVTAILIRAGYRVYRPEADVSGKDLVIRIAEIPKQEKSQGMDIGLSL
jgi:phosphoglycolate phosphatase-like HAD superfamily hydrolase